MSEIPSLVSQPDFKRRRFLNWFPLGIAYALLYMGRYNLTVAKTSLGDLMSKSDFGTIFAVGTTIYALSFLINGPLVDKIGGRKGMLIALFGSMTANALMGAFLWFQLGQTQGVKGALVLPMSLLYGLNMYFQSYAAVSIVKVNAHWFHVRERGTFGGIFGAMISSGIFFAFTGNGLILDLLKIYYPDTQLQWIVFFAPAVFLGIIGLIEMGLLADSPGDAGLTDFDTGDMSLTEEGENPPVWIVLKRILTHPILMTVALVEFCTGVIRNGVMHWFPIYAKEIWSLPGAHPLRYGPLKDILLSPIAHLQCAGMSESDAMYKSLCLSPMSEATGTWNLYVSVLIGFGMLTIIGGVKAGKKNKGKLVWSGALMILAAFFPMGWGGLLCVAGILGANVAGIVSDVVFNSRRAPAAGGLYFILALCMVGMFAFVKTPGTRIAWSDASSELLAGDRIISIGRQNVSDWAEAKKTFKCMPLSCARSDFWNEETCSCMEPPKDNPNWSNPLVGPAIEMVVERNGQAIQIMVRDPLRQPKRGEVRKLKAGPELPFSPWYLGFIIFLMSLCVIGTHGLLSGAAPMDFGGRRGAATAVGVIDGFVYLGTAVQSVALGHLTTKDWAYWPMFMLPFGVVGFLLLRRIWDASVAKKK